jgi:GTP-binding protein Era
MSSAPGGVTPAPASHRCGVVALLGRPNAGKSTLLNALLEEKLAITAAHAQTTRGKLLGVRTRPGSQLIFYDTPGLHRGQRRFNLALNSAALAAAHDADVRVLLLPAHARWGEPEARIHALPAPVVLVRTQRDLASPTPLPEGLAFAAVLEVAAPQGRGLEALLDTLTELVPEGPALYPEDFLTDAPLRFLAAEQIREVAGELLREELPFALAVEVLAWSEAADGVRIRAELLVERDSQKAIAVGQGGRMLRALGSEARRRLGGLLGKTVHLNLWVRTDRNWTRRLGRARQLGYL